jgi:virginiamycin B lyase
MIRQVVFGLLLALAQPASPAGQIPISRLTADATLPISLAPGAAASDDAVWILDARAGSVVRVEAKGNKVGTAVPVGAQACASLVVAFTSVWAPSCGDRTVVRINPADLKVTAKAGVEVADPDGRIASGIGSIWVVTDRKGVVTRIDPDTNQPVAEIHVAGGAAAVLFHGDALWVTSGAGKTLTRINPHNNEIVETIAVGPEPVRLAAADGAVWTLNRGDGSVTRVDTATNKAVVTISIGKDVASGDIAAGEGSVWISASGVPLVRIDTRTNKLAQRFSGDGGGAVFVAHGSLWLAAGSQTLRLDPRLVAAMRP